MNNYNNLQKQQLHGYLQQKDLLQHLEKMYAALINIQSQQIQETKRISEVIQNLLDITKCLKLNQTAWNDVKNILLLQQEQLNRIDLNNSVNVDFNGFYYESSEEEEPEHAPSSTVQGSSFQHSYETFVAKKQQEIQQWKQKQSSPPPAHQQRITGSLTTPPYMYQQQQQPPFVESSMLYKKSENGLNLTTTKSVNLLQPQFQYQPNLQPNLQQLNLQQYRQPNYLQQQQQLPTSQSQQQIPMYQQVLPPSVYPFQLAQKYISMPNQQYYQEVSVIKPASVWSSIGSTSSASTLDYVMPSNGTKTL